VVSATAAATTSTSATATPPAILTRDCT
jgi:hypothetical protein